MNFFSFIKKAKADKRLLSIVLALSTLLTAMVVLPVTLPVIEAQAIADGTPGSSIFWNQSGVANGGAKSHIYSFSRLDDYYESSGSNCTNIETGADFFATRVSTNSGDPWAQFRLWTPLDVSTNKKLYVVIIAKLEYLVCNSTPYTRVYLINENGYVNILACESQNIEVAKTNAYWQAFVFDLSGALSGVNNIVKIRWDYLQGLTNDTYGTGSAFQIDSIALFQNKDDANFFASERLAMRNNASYLEYKPCGLMNEVFGTKNGVNDGYTHNCHSEYNAGEKTIDLVADITCTKGDACPNAIFHAAQCTGELNSSFDTQITLETSVPLKTYQYMVMVYRLGTDLNSLPAPGRDDVGQVYDTANHPSEQGRHTVGIYPHLNGGPREGVQMQFAFHNNTDYNVGYIDLSEIKKQISDYDTAKMDGIRIDPFEYSYVANGSRMHIYAIYLCNDKNVVDNLINQLMNQYGKHQYQLNFDANKPTNSSCAVSNMPENMSFYSHLSTYPSFNLKTIKQPSRPNYNFLGWAESASATTPNYAVNTNSGPDLRANTPKTLYAVWQFQTGAWTVSLNSALKNTDQVYLFKITGSTLDPNVVTVTAIYIMLDKSKASETLILPVGNYTVEPVNGWNWRYTTKTYKSIAVRSGQTVSTTIQNSSETPNNRWLNGFARVIS